MTDHCRLCHSTNLRAVIDLGQMPIAHRLRRSRNEQEERYPRPLFLICGMINTKDQTGYFRAFEGMARHVYTVPVSMSEAGVPNDELAVRAAEAGLSAEPVGSVANALMLLRDTWVAGETPPRILIGGSLYLAGAVLAENGTPPV